MTDDRRPAMQSRHAAVGQTALDRRRRFERKLSEYSGYALLALATAMTAGLLAAVLI